MSKNYGNDNQLAEIVGYISDNMKLPIMGAGGGFAPIGTINFFDASIAPQGWLACDGTVYNIADYPELATFYASVHGASNFYGGNGTTTFAVPDLRGEFLRGTGTNSHANQGSGANVGVHQDGTWFSMVAQGGSDDLISTHYQNDALYLKTNGNKDSYIGGNEGVYYRKTGSAGVPDNGIPSSYTSRPTNTSFLICVKATVSGDPNAHQYSTEEQVIGKWIDGSDVYEKVISNLDKNIQYNTWTEVAPAPTNANMLIKADVIGKDSSNNYVFLSGSGYEMYINNGNIYAEYNQNVNVRKFTAIIIRYTKTTS